MKALNKFCEMVTFIMSLAVVLLVVDLACDFIIEGNYGDAMIMVSLALVMIAGREAVLMAGYYLLWKGAQ